ncbi:MAG: hypothetical protein [Caudoviricetes sp.]|nr:MAG: hypothetical protein [Caudoviricetes sp.]
MATKANLVIDQGSTYIVEIDLTDQYGDPLNLTGFVANSQIRKWYSSSNPAASFATTIYPPSTIVLTLTANQTSSLVAGRYVYDVEATSSTNATSRIVEGIVTVTPQVTR